MTATCKSNLDQLASKLQRRIGAHGHQVEPSVLWVHSKLLEALRDTARQILPKVFLVDRLMVGEGWWTVADDEQDKHPARYTLFSIKGGVGRSTTAAVLA